MPDSTDTMRKRLLFKCKHMGMVENDIIFGDFAESSLADLNAYQLNRLEAMLKENDVELFKWVTGDKPPPPAHDNDVMDIIKRYWYSVKNN